MPQINLCIVIVHYNCWDVLKECIDSIVVQTTKPSKLVVVDNDSHQSIKKNITEYKNVGFEIILIENNENLGFAKACNIGALASQEELILFCNPDIVIPNDGIHDLYSQYVENDINLLGCQLKNEDNSPQKVGGIFPSVPNLLPLVGNLIKKKKIKNFEHKNDIVMTDWITGAVILVSRKDLKKVGYWDESYFMYMEDVNLGKSAHLKLMKTGFTTKTTWLHHHGKSSVSNKRDRIKSKSSLIQSKHIYISKYFNGAKKYLAHLFVFLKYFPELLFALIIAPIIRIDEVKIKQQVALNTVKYYFNK